MLESLILPVIVTILVIAMLGLWVMHCLQGQKSKGNPSQMFGAGVVVVGFLIIVLTIVVRCGLFGSVHTDGTPDGELESPVPTVEVTPAMPVMTPEVQFDENDNPIYPQSNVTEPEYGNEGGDGTNSESTPEDRSFTNLDDPASQTSEQM